MRCDGPCCAPGSYTFIFIFITACVLLPDLSSDFVYFSTAIACVLSGGATAGMSGGIFGMVGQVTKQQRYYLSLHFRGPLRARDRRIM